jgi:hypothetical protein
MKPATWSVGSRSHTVGSEAHPRGWRTILLGAL